MSLKNCHTFGISRLSSASTRIIWIILEETRNVGTITAMVLRTLRAFRLLHDSLNLLSCRNFRISFSLPPLGSGSGHDEWQIKVEGNKGTDCRCICSPMHRLPCLQLLATGSRSRRVSWGPPLLCYAKFWKSQKHDFRQTQMSKIWSNKWLDKSLYLRASSLQSKQQTHAAEWLMDSLPNCEKIK